jgi:thioredoxin-related protein
MTTGAIRAAGSAAGWWRRGGLARLAALLDSRAPHERPFMNRLAAIAAGCAILLAAPLPAASQSAGAIAWRGWDQGLSEARATGRTVLVDVVTDWCGWCKRMDREVYARPEVRELVARHFVAIRLDAESGAVAHYEGRTTTARGIAGRFRVTGYPTTVFLRADGTHLVNVPGFMTADRFTLLLRYIGEGHADRGVDFREFSRRPAP